MSHYATGNYIGNQSYVQSIYWTNATSCCNLSLLVSAMVLLSPQHTVSLHHNDNLPLTTQDTPAGTSCGNSQERLFMLKVQCSNVTVLSHLNSLYSLCRLNTFLVLLQHVLSQCASVTSSLPVSMLKVLVHKPY